jgi:membrane protein
MVRLLKTAFQEFSKDDAMSLSAALAYYTLLSLAPLLVLLVGIAGIVWGNDASAQQRFLNELRPYLTNDTIQTLKSLLDNSSIKGTGLLGTVLGIGTLLVGASGAFYQLQTALNKMWEAPPPADSSWFALVKRRAFAFLAVLATGVLLAVSFLLSAFLGTVGKFFAAWLPASSTVLMVWNWVLSLGIMILFFGLIFRLLPDVRIPWKDVWIGALTTSILFQVGNIGISYYLSNSGTASPFGVASSVVVLLIWINYSTVIFLFGAEFTKVYSHFAGSQQNHLTRPQILHA